MKRVFSLLMFLAACGSPDDSSPQDSAKETSPPPSARAPANPPQKEQRSDRSDPSMGPCGRVQEFRIPVDGGEFVYYVPLPCDPLWKLKDRGDPPPFSLP